MPQGIEIYGPNGQLWATTADYLAKFRGSVTFDPGTAGGYVATPGTSDLPVPVLISLNPGWVTHTETVQGPSGAQVTLRRPLVFSPTLEASNNRANIVGPAAQYPYESYGSLGHLIWWSA